MEQHSGSINLSNILNDVMTSNLWTVKMETVIKMYKNDKTLQFTLFH